MRRTLVPCLLALVALSLASAASAAPSEITTIAGDYQRPGPALERGMTPNAAVRQGDLTYIADGAQHVVWAVDDEGTIRLVAGTGEVCPTGNLAGCIGETARQTRLSGPVAMVFDADGALLLAVGGGIVKLGAVDGQIRPQSPVTRIAGDGNGSASSGDGGPASAAKLAPRQLTLDLDGSLYIADGWALTARRIAAGANGRIDPNDGIATVVGTGASCAPAGNADANCGYGGPASGVALSDTLGLAVDGGGTLYVADARTSVVLKVDPVLGAVTPSSTVTRIAGDGSGVNCADVNGGCGDGGPATAARFSVPGPVASGPASLAVLPGTPTRIAVADLAGRRVRAFALGGAIQTLAGGTECTEPFGGCGSGGPATSARYSFLSRLSRSEDGSLLVGDSGNGKVHRVAAVGGVIGPASTSTTIAGSGALGAGCGGPTCPDGRVGGDAPLGTTYPMAVAPNGTIYTSEIRGGGYVIRRMTTDGVVTTIAGGPAQCASATIACGDNGPASAARFLIPNSLTVDPQGRLLIADPPAGRLRRIAADGGVVGPDNTITTLVGTGPGCAAQAGACGDGGTAGDALMRPAAVATNARGDLYVSDYDWARVRRVVATDGSVSPSSRIESVVGDGVVCATAVAGQCGEGGPAGAARIGNESRLAVTATGDLIVYRGARLLRVDAADGIADAADTVTRLNPDITSACLGGTAPCGDGGPLSGASFHGGGFFNEIKADAAGGVYVADLVAYRVRRIRPVGGTLTPDSRIEAFAGSGEICGPSAVASCGDGGPARDAKLTNLFTIATSGFDLIVSDRRRLRKVERTAAPGVALSATPATGAGPLATTLNLGTVEAAGPIASWRLSFGDGSPDTSGTGAPPATVAHTYADGAYTARLTVTDDLTDPASATTQIVAGDDDAPRITALSAAPSTFRVAPATGEAGSGAGTVIGFDLSEPASFTATLLQGTRTVMTLGASGAGTGRTSFPFRGRTGARPLPPGAYTVAVVARDPSGNTSPAATTTITITGPTLTAAVRKRSLQTVIRSKGILVAMKCPRSACTVNASVKLGRTTLGKVKKSLPSNRSTLVRIPLSKAGLKTVRKRKTIRITVPVTATDPGGNTAKKTAKATVKRAK